MAAKGAPLAAIKILPGRSLGRLREQDSIAIGINDLEFRHPVKPGLKVSGLVGMFGKEMMRAR